MLSMSAPNPGQISAVAEFDSNLVSLLAVPERPYPQDPEELLQYARERVAGGSYARAGAAYTRLAELVPERAEEFKVNNLLLKGAATGNIFKSVEFYVLNQFYANSLVAVSLKTALGATTSSYHMVFDYLKNLDPVIRVALQSAIHSGRNAFDEGRTAGLSGPSSVANYATGVALLPTLTTHAQALDIMQRLDSFAQDLSFSHGQDAAFHGIRHGEMMGSFWEALGEEDKALEVYSRSIYGAIQEDLMREAGVLAYRSAVILEKRGDNNAIASLIHASLSSAPLQSVQATERVAGYLTGSAAYPNLAVELLRTTIERWTDLGEQTVLPLYRRLGLVLAFEGVDRETFKNIINKVSNMISRSNNPADVDAFETEALALYNRMR